MAAKKSSKKTTAKKQTKRASKQTKSKSTKRTVRKNSIRKMDALRPGKFIDTASSSVVSTDASVSVVSPTQTVSPGSVSISK